jgi:hypothetical protein
LDFTVQPGVTGLGRLSDEAQHGLSAHPTLAVTLWAGRLAYEVGTAQASGPITYIDSIKKFC